MVIDMSAESSPKALVADILTRSVCSDRVSLSMTTEKDPWALRVAAGMVIVWEVEPRTR